MDRRQFIATLAGLHAAARGDVRAPGVSLEGIVGPVLPCTLELLRSTACEMNIDSHDARLFELRTYRYPGATLVEGLGKLFPDARLLPIAEAGERSWLIPFQSLEEREQAWNLANSRPEWADAQAAFDSYGFAIYRVAR